MSKSTKNNYHKQYYPGSAGEQLGSEATARYTEGANNSLSLAIPSMEGSLQEKTRKGTHQGSPFNTLAQPGTKKQNTLSKRALAKYITMEIVYPLIDLKSPLEMSYWHTYHCSRVLLQDGKKIIGNYCNHRWCLVCNRIRTGKLINGYLPVIKDNFKEPHFVTLTVPNCQGPDLKATIEKMTKTIIKVNHLFRHRRDYKLIGIRKLEVTRNAYRNDYHPHFHLLIEGSEPGHELISQWLKHYPEAVREAQDIRPADQHSLIELFKYSTKLSAKDKQNPEGLDMIFRALYKKRIFQPMGVKKLPDISEDIDELQSQEVNTLTEAIDVWCWENDIKDWVNSSGEMLTYAAGEQN